MRTSLCLTLKHHEQCIIKLNKITNDNLRLNLIGFHLTNSYLANISFNLQFQAINHHSTRKFKLVISNLLQSDWLILSNFKDHLSNQYTSIYFNTHDSYHLLPYRKKFAEFYIPRYHPLPHPSHSQSLNLCKTFQFVPYLPHFPGSFLHPRLFICLELFPCSESKMLISNTILPLRICNLCNIYPLKYVPFDICAL